MPFDPPKKHLDNIPAVEAQWRPLQGGAHLISSTTRGDKHISHITLCPDAELSHPGNATNSHELGYYRKPETRTSLEDFGAIDGFASGKSALNGEAKNKLKIMAQKITAYLHTHPNTHLSIVGFTDESGFANNNADTDKNARDNEKLSKYRAAATFAALTPLLDPDVRNRVVIGTDGQGANNPIEHQVVSGVNRRVELKAMSSVQRQYYEIMHVPPTAYAAIADKPFMLDFGFGEKTKAVYGRASVEEARASIVFESPQRALASLGNKTPRMQLVVDDPKNVQLLVRAPDGAMNKVTMMQADETHMRIYTNGVVLAEVELLGPDGKPRDMEQISLGMVNHAGEITPIRGLSARNALVESWQKSASPSAGLENGVPMPSSAPPIPDIKRLPGQITNHR